MSTPSRIEALALSGRLDEALARLAEAVAAADDDATLAALDEVAVLCASAAHRAAIAARRVALGLRPAPPEPGTHGYATSERAADTLADQTTDDDPEPADVPSRPVGVRRREAVLADDDAPHLHPDDDDLLATGIELSRDRDALLEPTHADLVYFLHLFAGREDVWARQWADGTKNGYAPVRGPLTPELLRGHLSGSLTAGVYPVRTDDTVTFVAFDLDIRRSAREKAGGDVLAAAALRALVRDAAIGVRDGLRRAGLPVLLENSGNKGWHVWIFLAEPAPADLAVNLGRAACAALRPASADINIEVFPRQARVAPDGLGNLIKLPLGVHRVTGRRAWIVDDELRPVDDPWATLRQVRRVDRAALLDAIEALRALPQPPAPTDPGGGTRPQRGGDAVPARTTDARPPAARDSDAVPVLTPAQALAHPVAGPVFAGCAVLRALADHAAVERRLSHDERVVIAQSLGALHDGPAVVNAVFAQCPEVPRHEHLRRMLRGHPISCAGVRRRVPHITQRVACNCLFDVGDRYPSPVLHAPAPLAAPPAPPPAPAAPYPAPEPPRHAPDWDVPAPAEPAAAAPTQEPDAPTPVEPAARRAVVGAHDAWDTDLDQEPAGTEPDDGRAPLATALAAALRQVPDQRLQTPDGTYRLRRVGDRDFVVFTPRRHGG